MESNSNQTVLRNTRGRLTENDVMEGIGGGALTSSNYRLHASPFTRLILDFKGRHLNPEEIESDYNSSINYPNNYFVAPERWKESFFTVSRNNMLQVSVAIENIVRVRPPFNRFDFYALFQTRSNFGNVRRRYEQIGPLTKRLWVIGPGGTGNGPKITNSILIDSSGSGLQDNWVVVAIADDEGCALVAEEMEPGNYRGFFTTNKKLAERSVSMLKSCLSERGFEGS